MSFANDTLRLLVEPFEFGFVVLNEQVVGHPRVYEFNSSWFPDVGIWRA
jgi:hypothetical protein